jgi:hypothetical protein
LRAHLINCYPNAFKLKFSADHETMIQALDRAASAGLIKALAMPRGHGKSTIIIRAGIWAILTGRRRFCTIIGATAEAAVALLKGIKAEIQGNSILRRLYGQEIHGLWSLHGESRLANGQRFKEERTGVEWLKKRISFGEIPGSGTEGAVITTVGLTGNIRGQVKTLLSGLVIRPDLALGDDLQTKESAKSPGQTQDRYDLVMGDLMGMAGPDKTLATILSGTVIYRDDLMERLLDRVASPVCQGDRFQLVYEWPEREDLWQEYRSKRETDLRLGGDGANATAYVKANFEEMHRGSRVGWSERYLRESEVSALQHAYNLKFRDEATFWAEMQNNPAGALADTPFELDPIKLMARTTSLRRHEIPLEAEKLVAFVDVQGDVLFYVVMAWALNGRGAIVDYGTWPEQRRRYFTKAQIGYTLQEALQTEDQNAAIYGGLSALINPLFERLWKREDGSTIRMDLAAIDSGWGYSTATVRRWCRENPNVGRIHPMKGHAIGINERPWSSWTHKKTDRIGHRCKMTGAPRGSRGVGEVLVDTNFWKCYAAERLTTTLGADASISFFASKNHRLLADHLAAETPELVRGRSGNEAVVWTQTQTRDNDLFDCVVGTCVLGSILGVRIDGSVRTETDVKVQRKPKKKRQFVGM